MNFFIRKKSTLPILRIPITEKVMEYYNITEEMFENVAITFSMVNAETGFFRIANVAADLEVVDERIERAYVGKPKHNLVYKFKKRETNEVGYFIGEFVIDFLGENGCGKIKFPINEDLQIIISDSITKTTVI